MFMAALQRSIGGRIAPNGWLLVETITPPGGPPTFAYTFKPQANHAPAAEGASPDVTGTFQLPSGEDLDSWQLLGEVVARITDRLAPLPAAAPSEAVEPWRRTEFETAARILADPHFKLYPTEWAKWALDHVTAGLAPARDAYAVIKEIHFDQVFWADVAGRSERCKIAEHFATSRGYLILLVDRGMRITDKQLANPRMPEDTP